MAEFVASDYHFFHNNICGENGFVPVRRRFRDAHEMNETIIANHNKVVTNNDIVYVAGDLGMNAKPRVLFETLKRLNGQLWLVLGNHDSMTKLFKFFEKNNYQLPNGKMKFVFEPMGIRLKRDGKVYMVTHYPLGLGEKRKKLRNFHGHIHEFPSREANLLNICIDSPELPDGHPFGAPLPLDVAITLVEEKWQAWFDAQKQNDESRRYG